METIDKSTITLKDRENWIDLIDTIHATRGKNQRVKIHKDVFWYFLEVLPPKWMGGGQFVFAEGEEDPTLYAQIGEYYYAAQFPCYKELGELLGVSFSPNVRYN